MADFSNGVSDEHAQRLLGRAIQGKGAFRRFKDELHQHHPDLVPAWHAFRDARAERRAVEWLLDQGLVESDGTHHFLSDRRDPVLP